MQRAARHAGRLAAEGVGVGRAVVVRTFGSAPRPEGAVLLVTDDGRLAGSVSGGCVEGAAAEEIARPLRRTGRQRVIRYGISDEQAWDVGLACGGTIDVLVAAERARRRGRGRARDAPTGRAGGRAIVTPLPADAPPPSFGAAPARARGGARRARWSSTTTAASTGRWAIAAADAALVEAALRPARPRRRPDRRGRRARRLFIEAYPVRPAAGGRRRRRGRPHARPAAKELGYETVVIDGRVGVRHRRALPRRGPADRRLARRGGRRDRPRAGRRGGGADPRREVRRAGDRRGARVAAAATSAPWARARRRRTGARGCSRPGVAPEQPRPAPRARSASTWAAACRPRPRSRSWPRWWPSGAAGSGRPMRDLAREREAGRRDGRRHRARRWRFLALRLAQAPRARCAGARCSSTRSTRSPRRAIDDVVVVLGDGCRRPSRRPSPGGRAARGQRAAGGRPVELAARRPRRGGGGSRGGRRPRGARRPARRPAGRHPGGPDRGSVRRARAARTSSAPRYADDPRPEPGPRPPRGVGARGRARRRPGPRAAPGRAARARVVEVPVEGANPDVDTPADLATMTAEPRGPPDEPRRARSRRRPRGRLVRARPREPRPGRAPPRVHDRRLLRPRELAVRRRPAPDR